jgi:hypothetical protein
MTISQHADTFAGLPVVQFDPDEPPSRTGCAYRLALGYEDKYTFPELLDLFLTRRGGDVTALVIGAWHYEGMLESAAEVVEALAAARDRMPGLRALFFGDITYEECEISWIRHGDVSALLPAFPKLEEFRIRGASDLTFGAIRHPGLTAFAVESGGLPAALLDEVWAADLPKLDHLELWLGDENYGGIGNTAPLDPLFTGNLFPKLNYLGLRNCDIADRVAAAVAAAPILDRLKTLDLSLGNIGDDGARALIASPAVRKLEKLDLHHHFISKPVVAELGQLGVTVDVSGPKEPHTYGDESYRYITAAE